MFSPDAPTTRELLSIDYSDSTPGVRDSDSYAAGYDGKGTIIAWIDLADGTVAGTAEYGAGLVLGDGQGEFEWAVL